MMNKTIIGFVESIKILQANKIVNARIDSGATIGSIDSNLVKELNLPIIGKKKVRSSHGISIRELIELDIEIAGKEVSGVFSVYDRSLMKFPVLIGQNILKKGFLIDPQKE